MSLVSISVVLSLELITIKRKKMKSLIKQLEIMGQTKSLKQATSAKQIIELGQYDTDLIEQVFQNSSELICIVEPQDDEE